MTAPKSRKTSPSTPRPTVPSGGLREFDVVVIGGGSGGYAAARTAAAAGRRVAVVDGASTLGGLCILRGCMPTKALLHAADVVHLARRAGTWGIRTGRVGFDFAQVMARKDALIREFAEYRQGQLQDGRFTLIRDTAAFVGPQELVLGSGEKIRAGGVVVATGSRVAFPPIPGMTAVEPMTSDDALVRKTPPKSLIVLGGGAVALEFAQFFARFGTRVTVIQRSDQVLKDADADAARVVEEALRREGLTVLTGTHLVAAMRRGKTKQILFQHDGQQRAVAAEEILVALGRHPHTAELGLDRAGVKVDDRGRILTDLAMRTNVPHIYAAGDCTSPHEIVHLAVMQGEVAGHNLVHGGKAAERRMDYRLLTHVVFTDPAVAVVGLTEKEAVARRVPYRAASYPFNDHGKSLILGATEGFVKLLADPKSGEILGGCCVGPQAGELIHEIVAAMAKRMTAAELAAMPHYHPTLAEIWTYPAEELA